MRCETAREAVSALMDGEPPPVPVSRLGDHLEHCPQCHAWRTLAGHAADVTLSGCLPAGPLAEAVAAQRPPAKRARTHTAPAHYGTGAKVVHAALALEVCLLVTASGLPTSALAVALPAAVGVSVTVQQAVARRAASRAQPAESELSLVLPAGAVPGRRRPYAAPAGKSSS
ncbi:zf-HC2 domain-containing protein [Nocardia zapadnayensis]|uniref:zf-HC2 domain-containing protein n=1 Tax=Nocardia rhamnosiphila TaxID=426716 RepID=UPI0022477071|nr:zf-HC2 domain-containing protein [Nocardia zapadnayensis]MCX0272944.1 zf-HC2 domain-containing protein [Nocardia zapadnayensis]